MYSYITVCTKTYARIAPDTSQEPRTPCTLLEEHKGVYQQDCINLACSKNIHVVFHYGSTCQLRACVFDNRRAVFRNAARSYWNFYLHDPGTAVFNEGSVYVLLKRAVLYIIHPGTSTYTTRVQLSLMRDLYTCC